MVSELHEHSEQRGGASIPRCVLLSTGGTIASRVDAATGLAMPTLSGKDLLGSLPEFEGRIDVEVEEVTRIPSPHMGPEQWRALHERVSELVSQDVIAGVVISHGTGLLEETAWFLDLTLTTEKPVVLLGAQRNSSEPDHDGPRNLLAALQVCVHSEARGKGVLVVMNNHINAARDVSKTHTFNVDTFHSGDWGCLGTVHHGRVDFRRSPVKRMQIAFDGRTLPRVDVIPMYGGASGSLIKAAVADGAKGIVIQALGAGHVNPCFAHAITDVLRGGIPVVVATRSPGGGTRACYGFEGSSQMLQNAGAVLAGDLSAWKARIVLMLAIAHENASGASLRELLDT